MRCNAAAGLAGVEVRAVDDVLDRVREIRIVAHVRRIAAAELEPGADEARRGRTLHGVTAGDRTGERDEIDARIANRRAPCLRDSGCSDLEHAVRQTCFLQALGEALGTQRRLRRMLQDDGVARHQRRHDAVHRDEIRVVPGRDVNTTPSGSRRTKRWKFSFGPASRSRERLRRNRDHVPRALERAAHLVRRVADRPAHLPRELLGDLVALASNCVAERGRGLRRARERHGAPRQRCAMRARSQRVASISAELGERTLDVDAPSTGLTRLLRSPCLRC